MSRKVAFIVSRVVGFLVFVALIVGGGAMAYRAGVAQGVVQAPAVATAISQAAENGQAVPPMMYGYGHPYPYGYGYGMHGFGGHHFGFFPLGGICFSIFFLFLFFGFMKMIFFRRMWGGHHMRGPWGKHWEGGVPPMFNEWHKRAHDEKPAEEGDKKE